MVARDREPTMLIEISKGLKNEVLFETLTIWKPEICLFALLLELENTVKIRTR